MLKSDYILKLLNCPYNDVNCPFWDYRYQKCDRIVTSEPENKNKPCIRKKE